MSRSDREEEAPAFAVDVEQLEALAARWLREMPMRSLELLLAPPEPGEGLRALLTSHEPARAEALADAPLYCARGRPMGLGLEVKWVGGRPCRGPAGEPGLAEATFQVSWADRMDPFSQQVEGERLGFAQLWREAGQWRIGRLFSERQRTEARAQHELLARRVRQRRGEG